MKGIIWYRDDYSKGIEQLKIMIDNYERMKIPVTENHFSKYDTYVVFENGDTWKVVGARECGRANRCNVAYVERNIDYDIYKTIISPTMINFPFSAVHFWGEGNLHISDELPLPF